MKTKKIKLTKRPQKDCSSLLLPPCSIGQEQLIRNFIINLCSGSKTEALNMCVSLSGNGVILKTSQICISIYSLSQVKSSKLELNWTDGQDFSQFLHILRSLIVNECSMRRPLSHISVSTLVKSNMPILHYSIAELSVFLNDLEKGIKNWPRTILLF